VILREARYGSSSPPQRPLFRIRRDLSPQAGDPQRIDLLEHHFVVRHDLLLVQLPQPGPDPFQAVQLFVDPLLQLGFLQPEHAHQLIRGGFVVQQPCDLLEPQSQIFQRQDPVQAGKLVEGVEAVAG
jgi:hypothetical protein